MSIVITNQQKQVCKFLCVRDADGDGLVPIEITQRDGVEKSLNLKLDQGDLKQLVKYLQTQIQP